MNSPFRSIYIFQRGTLPIRVAMALGIFASCLLLRLLILPADAGLAFITFYPGTAVAALFCGFVPALIYIVTSGVVGMGMFLPIVGNPTLRNYVPFCAFILSATIIAAVIHYLQRTSLNRAEKLRVSNEALSARETELMNAMRLARIGTWSWDARTNASWASPEFCRIFGLESTRSKESENDVLFTDLIWQALQRARDEVLRSGVGDNLELPAKRDDGSELWVNSRSEPTRDASGTIIGLHGMVQDITDRKQAEFVAQREHFIRTVTDAIPGMLGYWDRYQRCKFANKAYRECFGKSAEVARDCTVREFLGEDLYAQNEPHILAALAGEPQQFERTLTHADGSVLYVLSNYVPDIDSLGRVSGFFVLYTDVTPLKLAQAELNMAATVFQNTLESIMVTDAAGMIISVNPAFTEVTGYSAQETVGQTPRMLRSHRHPQNFYTTLWQQISSSGKWQGEIWNRRKNGEVFLSSQTIIRVPNATGESHQFVSVFHDATDKWSRSEEIRHLAFHDALTDLPNRSLLIERLEHQIAMTAREDREIAVLFLDLDHFKAVNDSLGHAVGDEVLITVAKRLKELVRQSDTVARLGGDEFVILLENPANQAEIAHIAERVISVINTPVEVGDKVAQIGTSIGIAVYPEGGATAQELIKSADLAMYAAKNIGRNTFRFFTPELKS